MCVLCGPSIAKASKPMQKNENISTTYTMTRFTLFLSSVSQGPNITKATHNSLRVSPCCSSVFLTCALSELSCCNSWSADSNMLQYVANKLVLSLPSSLRQILEERVSSLCTLAIKLSRVSIVLRFGFPGS